MTKEEISSALFGFLLDAMSSICFTYGAEFVPSSGGLRMEHIGRLKGVTYARHLGAMRGLLAAGLVKRTGNTRATRWSVVAQ